MDNKDNKNDKNINYEKEGVYYTPSENTKNINSIKSFEDFESFNKSTKKKNSPKKAPKKIPAKKSTYPVFMSIAIGFGAVAFIALFIIMHNTFNSGKSSVNAPESQIYEPTTAIYTQTEAFEEDNVLSGEEYIGVIRLKSETLDAVTIYNITADENADYKITGSTELRDEYGKNLVIDEFTEGDVISFIYDDDNNLTLLKKTNKGFKETIKNGFKINKDNMTISAGMKTYSYSEMTKFIYKDDEFDPALLDSSVDIITISGYDDKIWSVTLNKGHGEIEIVKNDKIKDGIIEIDTNIYKKLIDADTIKLNEGAHKIVVKGSNIDSFTKDIGLAVNEKYTLDLSAVKIKKGKVKIRPNVTDFALYINGKLELSRDPLEFEYGSYDIEIVKNGYVTYTSRFTVNSPEKTITPQLAQEVLVGTLTVTSNPAGATLLIDGISAGTTPYKGDISQGEHSITLKKEGYKDITISSINISDHEAIYNMDLQKEQI